MSKKRWNVDKLIGITAMIISLSTLIVFVYQTNLIRKQQYMSVYPHLNLGNYNTESLNYKFALTNDGVGPAFIREISIVSPDGKPYDSLVDYLESMTTPKDSLEFHYSDINVGDLIQAKENIILFGLSDIGYTSSHNKPDNTLASADKLYDLLNNDDLSIYIVYESIYGERWYITGKSVSPTKL